MAVNFKRIFAGVLAAMTMTVLFACGNENSQNENKEDEYAMYDYDDGFSVRELAKAGYDIETVNIEIEGLTKSYHYIIGADLHIIVDSDEVADESKELVQSRIKMFTCSKNDVKSADQWKTLPDLLNKCNADALFFNADMIDYNSKANTDAFKEGLDKLTVPFYYLRADHDEKPSYISDNDKKAANKRQQDVCDFTEIYELEYDEFIILAINDVMTNFTNEKLKHVKDIFAKGKPVILVSHPPFESLVETTNPSDRLGPNTGYTYFNAVMKKYITTVTEEDSPVIYILAGHTHKSSEEKVTEKISQHVFGTLAGYNIGVVNVIPKQ